MSAETRTGFSSPAAVSIMAGHSRWPGIDKADADSVAGFSQRAPHQAFNRTNGVGGVEAALVRAS